MPSKSKSQQRLMQAAAHNKEFAKKAGVSQDVAKEYVQADKDSGKKELPEHVEKKPKPTTESLAKKWSKGKK